MVSSLFRECKPRSLENKMISTAMLNHLLIRWLMRPKIWRLVSFACSVVGMLCYGLSSSFNHLFGKWNLLKILLYSVFSFIVCLAILFAKTWQGSTPSLQLKAHLEFSVIIITTVYSFFFDKANGKPDAYSLISCSAFAIMSLTLSSVQTRCGFEVDLLYFFCGYLTLQLMKVKMILVIVGAGVSYSLIILRFHLCAPRPPTEGGHLGIQVQDQHSLVIQVDSNSEETNTGVASLDSTAQTGQPSGGDWQEEVYQKIKTMKENYLPELNEMYQKIATKLQQYDSLPQQPKSDQLDKLKVFKMMLERIITFLQVSKSNISPNLKEKLGPYEKQILNFINTNRPRKAMSSMQPGQFPPPHMHSMSQSQPQVSQVQSHENRMNSQLQTTNIQGSVGAMQQNNMTSMQNNMTAQTGQPSGADWEEEVYQEGHKREKKHIRKERTSLPTIGLQTLIFLVLTT